MTHIPVDNLQPSTFMATHSSDCHKFHTFVNKNKHKSSFQLQFLME